MQGCQETAMSSFITKFLCWVQIPIYCLKIHDHRIFTQMIINKYLRFTNAGGKSNQRRKDVSPNRQAEDNVVNVMWFEDTVIAQVSRTWHTRNTFVSLPRHERIFPASVNQETKPSVKAFYFQRFECSNGNLILSSWLWVSWGYTQVSEYREQGAYSFDTLSFGLGHCHPMSTDIFLVPFKTSFSAFQSLFPQLQVYLCHHCVSSCYSTQESPCYLLG